MARGNVLPGSMKILIAQIYLENRDRSTRKIREEVIRRWHQTSRNYDDSNWPGLSAVQKVLAECRKRDPEKLPESEGLSKPWSTMSMIKYPIPPEALPSVLKVWVWAREHANVEFTIREAQWAARLYAATDDIALLALLSRMHSIMELVSLIIGESPEEMRSHGVDLSIFEKMTGQEITPERRKKILRLSEEEWLAEQELEKYLETHGADVDKQVLEHLYQKYVKPSETKGGKP